MGKKASDTPRTRNSITLDDAMWAEIETERRAGSGKVPTKMDMVRRLLREALDARQTARAHGARLSDNSGPEPTNPLS